MIDVGANIGDTVVFTNIVDGRYLLIEGEKSYNQLIDENLKQNHFNQTKTIIENTFIGDCQGTFSNTLQDGSGTLMATDNCENGVSILTLDEVVEKHNFQPNFIKIDTDGFDFKVIRSATKTLKQYAPVLFFEWDKFFLEGQGENPLSIFPLLQELGYSDIFVFDNFGTLLCKEKIDNLENLSLLLNYTKLSKQNIYYYDLLVIHNSQKHIFDSYNFL